MKLVLLCSGKGERLKPLSDKIPKSLVPINGEPNLLNTCKLFCSTNLFDEVIVAGRNFEFFNHDLYQKVRSYFYGPSSSSVRLYEVSCDCLPSNCNNCETLNFVFSKTTDPLNRDLDSYVIVEGDIYIDKGFLDIFKRSLSNPEERELSAVYCTYRKNEWTVVKNFISRKPQIVKDSDGLSLSGVSYISSSDILGLKSRIMHNLDKSLFWDELFIDNDELESLRVIDCEETLTEYDYISDLIESKMTSPEEIAMMISDDGTAQRCDSMTNDTFVINFKGRRRILKLPKSGTDLFINRERESKITTTLSVSGLAPQTITYSNGVKIVDYIENHRVSNSSDIRHVLSMICSLQKFYTPDILTKDLLVNLIEEISQYESMYSHDIFTKIGISKESYNKVKNFYVNFIRSNQYQDISLCHRDLDLRNVLINLDKTVLSSGYFIDFEYSGLLNRYWDFGCYFSELVLKGEKSEEDILSEFSDLLGESSIVMKKVLDWSRVVDFIWSCWSIAQCSLGEDCYEYLRKRWERCSSVVSQDMI